MQLLRRSFGVTGLPGNEHVGSPIWSTKIKVRIGIELGAKFFSSVSPRISMSLSQTWQELLAKAAQQPHRTLGVVSTLNSPTSQEGSTQQSKIGPIAPLEPITSDCCAPPPLALAPHSSVSIVPGFLNVLPVPARDYPLGLIRPRYQQFAYS